MKCKTCGQEVKEWIPQIIAEKHLEWGEASEEEMNWDEAKKWCEEKGGRMPTIIELMEAYYGGIAGFKKDFYWSSSEYSSTYPFYLHFNYGNVFNLNAKSNALYVRCVRGK